MSLSTPQRQTIYYALLGPAFLSSLSCVFILVMFASFADLRNHSFKMILILAMFDLINSLAFTLPTYSTSNSSPICQTQAILLNFTTLAGLIWTTYIALHLYLALKSKPSHRILPYFLLTLIICAVNSIIPIVTSTKSLYGKTHGWCWIPDEYHILRYSLFFIPLLVIIPTNLLLYIKSYLKVKSLLTSQEDLPVKQKFKQKFMLYPLVLVICYLPYTVKAFLEFNQVETDELLFTLISGALRSLHGLLNFGVYGMNAVVRTKLKKCWEFRSITQGKNTEVSMQSAITLLY